VEEPEGKKESEAKSGTDWKLATTQVKDSSDNKAEAAAVAAHEAAEAAAAEAELLEEQKSDLEEMPDGLAKDNAMWALKRTESTVNAKQTWAGTKAMAADAAKKVADAKAKVAAAEKAGSSKRGGWKSTKRNINGIQMQADGLARQEGGIDTSARRSPAAFPSPRTSTPSSRASSSLGQGLSSNQHRSTSIRMAHRAPDPDS
jgi:hypothetical protein